MITKECCKVGRRFIWNNPSDLIRKPHGCGAIITNVTDTTFTVKWEDHKNDCLYTKTFYINYDFIFWLPAP